MKKIINYRCKKAKGLVEPLCKAMPEVQKIKCTDREIDGVVYRIWSAFKNETNAVDSLENLMLNRLESDESEEQTEQEQQDLITLGM
ncbi:MAG: hypothetical protein NC247_07625 [Ruminococcus flavefaciens]|nr:hypothetical protein [Ruminococcus flavefaciens]MCM1487430.1 hypothetical protein [Bacillota bacterium]